MAKLSRDDVLKLAKLSRIKLTEEEIKEFADEISKILDYVETLDEADTSGLEPTFQVTGLKNVWRTDEIVDYQAKPEEILSAAPEVKDKQYKVKRVLE